VHAFRSVKELLEPDLTVTEGKVRIRADADRSAVSGAGTLTSPALRPRITGYGRRI
jgi:hypothetical protein